MRNIFPDDHFKDEDKVIFKVHRHPFGLVVIYLFSLMSMAIAFASIIMSSELVFGLTRSTVSAIIIGMFFVAVLLIIFLLIVTKIYWSSSITLTDDEVRQTIRHGLFSTTSSRLGLANVEDVTVRQSGIFANLFGFGRVDIETAGEQANFKFNYCPKPGECAKAVMQTREKLLEDPAHSLVARN